MRRNANDAPRFHEPTAASARLRLADRCAKGAARGF